MGFDTLMLVRLRADGEDNLRTDLKLHREGPREGSWGEGEESGKMILRVYTELPELCSKTILKAPWFLDTNCVLNWQHKIGGGLEMGDHFSEAAVSK